jgi:hypothetical protein
MREESAIRVMLKTFPRLGNKPALEIYFDL